MSNTENDTFADNPENLLKGHLYRLSGKKPVPCSFEEYITFMKSAANRIIVDVYNQIAGISTVLAGLMSAVAVIGAKVSNNQHKTDAAWDWLKRIWIAWAIINGMGAFLAYIRPLFEGLATLQ